MEYYEDMGFVNDGISTFMNTAINNEYLDYRFFLTVGTFFENSSHKTEEGNNFYNEITLLLNGDFSRFYKEYSNSFLVDNKKMQIRCRDIFRSLNKKFFHRNTENSMMLLTEFTHEHFFDVFGKFGEDEEKTTKSLDRVYRVEKVGEKLVYYEKIIPDEIQEQLAKTLDEIYMIYINSYENVERYGLYQLYGMLKYLRLAEIDIDALLLKYPNLSKEDIYKLLIYNIKEEYFERYLNLLNSINQEEKNKIFKYIKPMMYHFQYLPKYWTYPVKYAYTEYLVDMKFLMQLRFQLQDIMNNQLFEYSVDSAQIIVDYPLEYLFNESSEYCRNFFENIFFNGYSQEIIRLNNFFGNQIELLENIDYIGLEKLLTLKKEIINNPIKTKLDYVKYDKDKRETIISFNTLEIDKLIGYLEGKQTEIINEQSSNNFSVVKKIKKR